MSRSRTEDDAIPVIFDTLDVQNALKYYLFVCTNLSVLPKFGLEEINITIITDRQARMEETISNLSSNTISLKKLNTLSNQWNKTAAPVKDFGSAAQCMAALCWNAHSIFGMLFK